MSVLAALGLEGGGARALLIDPPEEALAEAGRLAPRPTIAASLQVAEPAMRIAWWPQREELDAASLSRLAWMLAAAGEGGGEGWLVSEGDAASPTAEELRAAVGGAGLRVAERAEVAGGGFALRLALGG